MSTTPPGDLQKGCKVTVSTGKYSYNITTDDESDYRTEYLIITYPEATLEAGVPVSKDDNLIMTIQLVGTVNGQPITFKGVQLNHTTTRGMCYETNTGVSSYYNDHLYRATGLEAEIFYISEDRTKLQARIYGIPKKQNSLTHYPFTLSGRGYTLNASYNSANHLIEGYTSGDTTLTITEPVVRATISKNVKIKKAKENMSVTYGEDETALFTKISKEAAKTSVDISNCLQVGARTNFRIWIAASAKKPASAIQEISAAARAAVVTEGAITYNATKHTVTLGKAFEVYDTEKTKWGGIPKVQTAGTYTFRIRKKADAKGGRENDTTYAAGEEMKLVIVYGEYTAGSSTKNGILSADVQLNQ